MKNIKKLSKSAIILYFVELVLAFAIIGLAVSAISAIGLERYKDWKNLSEAEKNKNYALFNWCTCLCSFYFTNGFGNICFRNSCCS